MDADPFITICCVLSARKLSIHDIGPVMPYDFSLWISLLCGTLSNALVKSRMAMSTDLFSSRDLLMSSFVSSSLC